MFAPWKQKQVNKRKNKEGKPDCLMKWQMEKDEIPVPSSETCEKKQLDHIISYTNAPGELYSLIEERGQCRFVPTKKAYVNISMYLAVSQNGSPTSQRSSSRN
ncbi:hypothetical protein KIN20_027563 [Parelaphostrongylus tenuis]|uniref:Uncharacterized protein n=1 Tax=Parelaphostrongylus tenuis TaxID=148309 RepID=A0AAD5QZM2_PARTN|nr:hypothetical protein KIN20_027563 [Parelaphostrongylus tenuis]